jgi:NTP pyrophosphatase (non-canonical NTP hydrolase)
LVFDSLEGILTLQTGSSHPRTRGNPPCNFVKNTEFPPLLRTNYKSQEVILYYVAIDLSELKNIRDMDLSGEKERKKVGPRLMEAVETGGETGIKSIQIIVENNLSYYAKMDSDKILNGIKRSDNLSYIYSVAQLCEFLYNNHGVFNELPDIIIEILDIKSDLTKNRKSYRTNLYRFYDKNEKDNLEQIAQEKFNDSIEILQESDINELRDNVKTGRRIRLEKSEKRGLVNLTTEFVEFEFYERVEKKVLLSNSDSSEYLIKSIETAYEIIEGVGLESSENIDKRFGSVIERLINIASTFLGEIGEKSFNTICKISEKLTREHKREFEKILVESVRDGFNLSPIGYLTEYVIKSNGDVFEKKMIKDNIKKYYNIGESPRFILRYESDTEKRKAYIALSFIDDISSLKIKLIKYGFTQFYKRD